MANEEAFGLLPPFVQESEARKRWKARYSNPELNQATLRDYYRLITGVDREVGRILEELQKLDLAKNTVIVFTSDNGFALGDRGLADKWFMYEESMRVPLLIADLRDRDPSRCRVESIVLNADIAPTLLDLALVKAPSDMQGRSLVPFLRRYIPMEWRYGFFYEHHAGPKTSHPAKVSDLNDINTSGGWSPPQQGLKKATRGWNSYLIWKMIHSRKKMFSKIRKWPKLWTKAARCGKACARNWNRKLGISYPE